MGGIFSKGSTSGTSEVALPPELRDAAINNINIGNEVAALGYTPNRGLKVAAMNPMQQAAALQANDAAGSFGMRNVDVGAGTQQQQYSRLTGLPAPQTASGGIQGYSAGHIYDDMVNTIPIGQRLMIDSFVRDPVTGALPYNSAVPQPQTIIDIPASLSDNPFEYQRQLREQAFRTVIASRAAGTGPSFDGTLRTLPLSGDESAPGGDADPGTASGAGDGAPTYDSFDAAYDAIFGDEPDFADTTFSGTGGFY